MTELVKIWGIIPLYSTFQYTLGSHGMEFHYLLTWEIPVLFGIKIPCDVGKSLVSYDVAGTFLRDVVNPQVYVTPRSIFVRRLKYVGIFMFSK